MTGAETLRALVAQGRHAQALAGTEGSTDPAVMILRAELLKVEGRLDEALAVRRAVVAARPTSAVAEHNLAALLGDMHQAEAAEAAVRRAFAKGGDAPETWLVLARALAAQMRFDEADSAYRQTLSRRPGWPDALRELSQLIWMRTGDRTAALTPFETTPPSPALAALRANIREYLGDAPAEIAADLAATGNLSDVATRLGLAHLLLDHDPLAAVAHAEAAVRLAPHDPAPRHRLAEALLATARMHDAARVLAPLLTAATHDQKSLALMSVVRRLAPDLPADPLDDLTALVRGEFIGTPEGWPNLPAFLTDLARDLRALHTLSDHPIGQSLRHGTQTTIDLKVRPEPTIQAFLAALDSPIRAYLAQLGPGPDPVRARNTGGYRLLGCWSVRLKPEGYHAPHIHPEGWLSSACHIQLPRAVDGDGRQGWLGFGGSPIGGAARLDPTHYERPEPGRLVLFPSCVWHGTVPFDGPDDRLTVAFDLAPA